MSCSGAALGFAASCVEMNEMEKEITLLRCLSCWLGTHLHSQPFGFWRLSIASPKPKWEKVRAKSTLSSQT